MSSFDDAGFLLIDDVIDPAGCDEVCGQLDSFTHERAGSRALLSHPSCRSLATRIRRHPKIGPLLPRDAVAVQCTLFNKTARKNWLVSFHQDLSIPVRERVEAAQCDGWSRKDGQWFVQPPDEVLRTLVAVRIHLDASTAENGPLRVVPGSHRFGRLSSTRADEQRQQNGEVHMLSSRGSALVMRPLLLHASSKSSHPTARRVLHLLMGPRALPCGLEWAMTV